MDFTCDDSNDVDSYKGVPFVSQKNQYLTHTMFPVISKTWHILPQNQTAFLSNKRLNYCQETRDSEWERYFEVRSQGLLYCVAQCNTPQCIDCELIFRPMFTGSQRMSIKGLHGPGQYLLTIVHRCLWSWLAKVCACAH